MLALLTALRGWIGPGASTAFISLPISAVLAGYRVGIGDVIETPVSGALDHIRNRPLTSMETSLFRSPGTRMKLPLNPLRST